VHFYRFLPFCLYVPSLLIMFKIDCTNMLSLMFPGHAHHLNLFFVRNPRLLVCHPRFPVWNILPVDITANYKLVGLTSIAKMVVTSIHVSLISQRPLTMLTTCCCFVNCLTMSRQGLADYL